jgi:hypothetical protein
MVYQLIGWIGTVLFILSYGLLSTKKLGPDTIIYQLMNLLGALCLVINAFGIEDSPTLVINIIWMCISMYAIITVRKKKAAV